MASAVVVPSARRGSRETRALGSWRVWVRAIRWRAAFSCRLPARLRRWRTWLADQTGIGAVPLCRANASLERQCQGPLPQRVDALRLLSTTKRLIGTLHG